MCYFGLALLTTEPTTMHVCENLPEIDLESGRRHRVNDQADES